MEIWFNQNCIVILMLKSLKIKLLDPLEKNDRNSLIRVEIWLVQNWIVILMLKSLKLKLHDPLKKMTGTVQYVKITVEIWFEQNCIVILMLKSLKLKFRGENITWIV